MSAANRDERTELATALADRLEEEMQPSVDEVESGPFAMGVSEGTFPREGIQFFVAQTYHLVMNDMGNLSTFVARARDEEEIEFFLFMTVAERLMLESLYLLIDALDIPRDELAASPPSMHTAYRTNYFTRLALSNPPGEIALAILLNFPVWAAGARRVSAGLKSHYGLGNAVAGTDKLDVDVLDRFSQATQGFRNMATRIVATDLAGDGVEGRMREVATLAVKYEAMVWQNYYSQGLLQAQAQ